MIFLEFLTFLFYIIQVKMFYIYIIHGKMNSWRSQNIDLASRSSFRKYQLSRAS